MKIGVGATLYGLRPIIDFMTFNFSMQAILIQNIFYKFHILGIIVKIYQNKN